MLLAENQAVNAGTLEKLAVFSSTVNKSYAAIDNIYIVPLAVSAELEAVEFNVDSEIADSTIYVNASDISDVKLVSAKVSSGAEYIYQDGVLTVTAENTEKVYTVKAVNFFTDDFESYAADTMIGSGDDALGNYSHSASGADSSEVYANDKKISLIVNNVPQVSSFILKYDLKYYIPENETYKINSWQCDSFPLYARDSSNKSLAGFQTNGSVAPTDGGSYKLKPQAYYNQGFNAVDGGQYYMLEGAWSHVKIVYNNGVVSYYLDGKLVAGEQTANAGTLNKLAMFSSTGNKSLAGLDNIRIIPLI